MCAGGIKAMITKKFGPGTTSLSSGGYDGGGGMAAMGATKSAIGQRRKAARLPIVPLLGQSGEDVNTVKA